MSKFNKLFNSLLNEEEQDSDQQRHEMAERLWDELWDERGDGEVSLAPLHYAITGEEVNQLIYNSVKAY